LIRHINKGDDVGQERPQSYRNAVSGTSAMALVESSVVIPGVHLLLNAAGTRPGGRDTFLLRGKKVPKESRPAFPARRSRAALPPQVPGGRLRKLAFGSNSEAALPRPCLAPLGGAEGNWLRLDGMVHFAGHAGNNFTFKTFRAICQYNAAKPPLITLYIRPI